MPPSSKGGINMCVTNDTFKYIRVGSRNFFFKKSWPNWVFFPTNFVFFYIQITVHIGNRCGILGIFIMLYGLHVGSVDLQNFITRNC